MSYAPIGQRPLRLAQQVVLQHDVRPPGFVKRVDQIKVDVIRLQLSQLFIEKQVKIRRPLHHPCG